MCQVRQRGEVITILNYENCYPHIQMYLKEVQQFLITQQETQKKKYPRIY